MTAGNPPVPRVDVHLHLSRWWQDLPRTGYRPDLDYTPRGLLAEMDRNSIDYGVVIQLHEAPSVREGLEEGRTTATAGGGRLLPITTVDPTRGEAEVRAAIDLWAKDPTIRGVKLYPGYQSFYPHDPRVEPILEFAHRRGIPVLVHQGDTLDPGGMVKFARPIELDEVAVRYRDVTFVLCHLGNPWIEEAAEVVYKNENVYADTSGLVWSPRVRYYEQMIEQASARIGGSVKAIGHAERVLYGSDWPLVSLEVAVRIVQGMGLEPEDTARVLGGNAHRLFRLGAGAGAPT